MSGRGKPKTDLKEINPFKGNLLLTFGTVLKTVKITILNSPTGMFDAY